MAERVYQGVSGHQVDDYEPQRPAPYDDTATIAARQRAMAEARLRAGEVVDRETQLVEERRRFLARHGLT
jgi:hypothetical protein